MESCTITRLLQRDRCRQRYPALHWMIILLRGKRDGPYRRIFGRFRTLHESATQLHQPITFFPFKISGDRWAESQKAAFIFSTGEISRADVNVRGNARNNLYMFFVCVDLPIILTISVPEINMSRRRGKWSTECRHGHSANKMRWRVKIPLNT